MQIPCEVAKELIESILDDYFISTREMAEVTGVTDATLYNIQNGNRKYVYPSTIRAITQHYPEYTVKHVEGEFSVAKMKTPDDRPQRPTQAPDVDTSALLDALRNDDLKTALRELLRLISELK